MRDNEHIVGCVSCAERLAREGYVEALDMVKIAIERIMAGWEHDERRMTALRMLRLEMEQRGRAVAVACAVARNCQCVFAGAAFFLAPI